MEFNGGLREIVGEFEWRLKVVLRATEKNLG
jgi:hypothetical protein